MAGDAKSAPITVVEPLPAPAVSPFSLEVAGTWTTPMQDANDRFHDLKMWGVDVTGVYSLNENLALTLRGTWASGTDASRGGFSEGTYRESRVNKADMTDWTITAGVRYTDKITEKLSWYAGANIGWGRTEMRYTNSLFWTDPNDGTGGGGGKWEGDDVGVAYSVEVGVKYDFCKNLYAVGSVGFRGMTTEPNFEWGDRAGQHNGITVSAGLGWQF